MRHDRDLLGPAILEILCQLQIHQKHATISKRVDRELPLWFDWVNVDP